MIESLSRGLQRQSFQRGTIEEAKPSRRIHRGSDAQNCETTDGLQSLPCVYNWLQTENFCSIFTGQKTQALVQELIEREAASSPLLQKIRTIQISLLEFTLQNCDICLDFIYHTIIPSDHFCICLHLFLFQKSMVIYIGIDLK